MVGLSERLESLPMTKKTWGVLIIIGLGLMFDSMDQGMISGVIAAIGKDWELTKYELSWLTSSGVLGMIVGAALSGLISDRYGRRTVILSTLLIFTVGSVLCGLATNYWMLLIFRFITGFGLGGELPAAITLASELSPKSSRGRNVVLVESFWAWGWLIASLVAFLAIPVYGWRAAFFIGAVPALFAAVLRFLVPESPRYLEVRGRYDEAEKIVSSFESAAGVESVGAYVPYVEPEKKSWYDGFVSIWAREHRRNTAVIWVIWFGVNFGYYGFVLWTPTLLTEQGFDIVKSFGYTVIMCIAQLPGYFSAAYLIERIGRKPTLIMFFAGTAVAAWFFGCAGSESQILAAGCLLYFFALGSWGSIYSYTPEVYPTDIRGAGSGWSSAFGRIGAFIAPFIVPVLYSAFGMEHGFTMVFILLSLVFAFVAVTILLFGSETKGTSLKDRSE